MIPCDFRIDGTLIPVEEFIPKSNTSSIPETFELSTERTFAPKATFKLAANPGLDLEAGYSLKEGIKTAERYFKLKGQCDKNVVRWALEEANFIKRGIDDCQTFTILFNYHLPVQANLRLLGTYARNNPSFQMLWTTLSVPKQKNQFLPVIFHVE